MLCLWALMDWIELILSIFGPLEFADLHIVLDVQVFVNDALLRLIISASHFRSVIHMALVHQIVQITARFTTRFRHLGSH